MIFLICSTRTGSIVAAVVVPVGIGTVASSARTDGAGEVSVSIVVFVANDTGVSVTSLSHLSQHVQPTFGQSM
eukprot:CAMPEP_0185727200 /NCGR_PEP_ID=MMETSP1171-20130828/2954_1 /TAXON_ID=374046 /ORGANISM="Helicotheca tamensis, Strain CCMP826" /LENGTH=72 /DNA_ID=CAMNT_0028395713 /DNA_START=120 /DNA_END=338 /DNA_ORIENTATION=-